MKNSRFFSKIISLAVVVCMILCFASCKDTSWVFKTKNSSISSGVYLGYLLDAYYGAYYSSDTSTDLFSQKIEGVSAEKYIKNTAEESCRKQLTVDSLFDEYKLKLTDEENDNITTSVDSNWESVSSIYSQNGCSKASFSKIIESNQKYNKLFEYYYGENGKEPVSEKQLKEFFSENYAKIKYVAVNYSSHFEGISSSADASDEQKTQLKKIAEDYASRINKGEDISAISQQEAKYSSQDGQESSQQLDYQFVTKDTSEDADSFNKTIFNSKFNTAVATENGSYGYYVFVRYKTDANGSDYTDRSSGVLSTMKSDEFSKFIEKQGKTLDITKNNSSIKRYKPQNIDLSQQ